MPSQKWVLVSLFLLDVIQPLWCEEDKLLLMDQLRTDFINLENKLWSDGETNENTLNIQFREFDRKLEKVSEDILYKVKPLRKIPKFLELQKEMTGVENVYIKLRRYLKNCVDIHNSSSYECNLQGLIYDIENNETGTENVVNKIDKILYEGDNCFLKSLVQLTAINKYPCENNGQSVQQLYYNFYNGLSFIRLKMHILLLFKYFKSFLAASGDQKADVVQNSLYAYHNYTHWIQNISDHLFIAKRDKSIRRCDPYGFIKGKSYDEFTRLLQGHIENEVDMVDTRSCKSSCESYSFTKSYGCYDGTSEFCQKIERCSGTITGCFFVDSDASICVSEYGQSRRYSFVTYKNGKTLGRQTHCSQKRTVNSWLRWFVQCSYCMCLCDEQSSKSDRFISLRSVRANKDTNSVVTGIKLVKKNRIMHIQIQEGKLLPYGEIDNSTVHWVEVDDYNITDKGIFSEKDFFTMTYGQRSMAMDDIFVDSNHVVTGVKFALVNNMIKLQLYATPFEWTTGKLINIQIREVYKRTYNRFKINIDNSDVPTRTGRASDMHNSKNSYVEFTHTDFDKDAAQTTIPFIDIQEVVTNPAVPLSGVGIYYKGNSGFGGFIAPKIFTYDYGKLVTTKFPAKPEFSFIFTYEMQ